MRVRNRIIAGFFCFVIIFHSVSYPFSALATVEDAFYYGADTLLNWLSGNSDEPLGGWTFVDWASALFSSNTPQAYYTTPTESVEDENGNVTNYYRGGDTTTTQILDSYNHTFNSIHNVSNTNDYEANIALENFLNSYTTNTNNYTYNTDYKSWYYDNTSQTYNYDASSTYYNTDNRQYYISIDNSTDEYYLVDIQYSPTFVTVNYTYNNIDNSVHHGNVTNVYYFELTDGRNSATLTADDVLGLDLGYDVTNYELITDDNNTLSLQHFDNEYADISIYVNEFYSENRSTTYVDSGSFGKAVKLSSGSAAGVKIPDLNSYDGLTFDFRIYYDSIDSLDVYLGDTCIFDAILEHRSGVFKDFYSDHDGELHVYASESDFKLNEVYTPENFVYADSLSGTITESHISPSKASLLEDESSSFKYGYAGTFSVPVLGDSTEVASWTAVSNNSVVLDSGPYTDWVFRISHYMENKYYSYPQGSVAADFAYSSFSNQWVSLRITIKNGYIWYFANGDQVGFGKFSMPSADKFYIKSSGTLYLDELRITTGDMVYTNSYVCSNSPYDTNKVLALPSELVEDMIYVRSDVIVSAWRVGGVRPSNPSKGFLYIPIYTDNSGGQSQIYDGNNWVNVETYIFNGSVSCSTKGYKFSPMGDSVDIADDNSSGSGDSSDDGSGDDSGDDDGSDSDSTSSDLLDKLAELVGVVVDGFLSLLDSTLGKILDALISIVTSTIERLAQVASLYGSFANSVGAIWSWLPPEIITVLVSGVTIFVFLAVIRFFFK